MSVTREHGRRHVHSERQQHEGMHESGAGTREELEGETLLQMAADTLSQVMCLFARLL